VLSDPGEGVGRGMDLGGSVGRGGVGAGVGAGVVGGSSSVWSLMVDPPLPRMVAWVSLSLIFFLDSFFFECRMRDILASTKEKESTRGPKQEREETWKADILHYLSIRVDCLSVILPILACVREGDV
jgi:hypothetical protein